MKHTEKEALAIIEIYKKTYNLTNQVKSIRFQSKISEGGYDSWFVVGESELFGEVREFIYIVNDQTGKVEYTMNEIGSINPHLPSPMSQEWEDYVDDDI